jgi:UDP-N-acetylglucosamine enolpyruvyl transferase
MQITPLSHDSHYQREAQRRTEQRNHAEKMRLAQSIRASQRTSVPVYAPLLAQLGETMVALGSRLRERYGLLSEAMPISAKPDVFAGTS